MITSEIARAQRIIEGQNGWTDGPVVAGFVIGTIALAAFVAWPYYHVWRLDQA